MISNSSIRAWMSDILWLTCLLGVLTTSAVCQQVSEQLNAKVHASSVSSIVVSPMLPNSHFGSNRGGEATSGEGFAPTNSFSGSSVFALTGLPMLSMSNVGDAFTVNKRSQSAPAASPLFPEALRAQKSSTSLPTIHAPRFGQLSGNSLTQGQFPDSTREVVLPSPLLGSNSLRFFFVSEPGFKVSFDSKRHLNPSYAPTSIRSGYQVKYKHYLGFDRSWTHSQPLVSNPTLASQPYSGLMAAPLGRDSLADPLKSQSSSLLAGD